MEKFKKFVKDLRFEYKILIVFALILLFSIPFTIVKKYSDNHKSYTGSTLSGNKNTESRDGNVGLGSSEDDYEEVEDSRPNSISGAVNANRPLIISESQSGISEEVQESIFKEIPETKGIEMATKVANPTIWVYALNDGSRKDEDAVRYCILLKNKGITPNSVFIYDERERGKGKLVEIGSAKCSN